MIANVYAFRTEWFVPAATPAEVAAVLERIADLPRWWPEVYLRVRIVEPGGEHAIGCVADVLTRGLLPYRLRWRMHVVSGEPARRRRLSRALHPVFALNHRWAMQTGERALRREVTRRRLLVG